MRGDQELYARNLQIFAEQVVERHGAISLELPVQDMTFAEENEILKIRFVFTGITGNDEASQITFENLEFYLLLKFEQ